MLKINTKKGFTIIELLVVITIIVLITIVGVASLGYFKEKSANSAIKADLVSAVKQIEIYYSYNSTYGIFPEATCPNTVGGAVAFNNDPILIEIIRHATRAGGNGSSCSSTGENYAISIGLKTAGQSWCVDSLGTLKQFTGTPEESTTNNRCN